LCWVAFVVVLGFAYGVDPAGRLDANALHGLMSLNRPFFGSIGNLIVHSVDPLPLLAMLAVLFLWGWGLGRRREAIAAVAMVAAANLTALLLQALLAHPRFYPILGTNQVGTEAYPSGHATSAMSIALAVVLVAPERVRVPVASGAAAYAFAVSISLLVLSWHLPSDVVGGLLVASAFFFCAVAAIRVRASRPTRDRARPGAGLPLSPTFGGIAAALLVGAFVVALFQSEELLAFARLHTAATATALTIMAVSAGLVASAASIAHR
jgi:membrane-associated phospholipid phosphatase